MDIRPIFSTSNSLETNHLRALSGQIAKTNQILSTGGLSSSYVDTADLSKFVQCEKELSALKAESKSDSVIAMHQKRTEDQIDLFQDCARRLQQLLFSCNTGSSLSPNAVHETAQCILNDMAYTLNTGIEGIQTLSGIAITTNAVDLSNLPSITHESGLLYDYYKGAEGNMEISLNANAQVVLYPVTARDDAFAKVIHAARLTLNVNPLMANDQNLEQAKRYCEEALKEDIPLAKTRITNQHKIVNFVLDDIPGRERIANETYVAVGKQDEIEALIKLQELQTSQEITQHLSIQQSTMNRKLADELIRSS